MLKKIVLVGLVGVLIIAFFKREQLMALFSDSAPRTVNTSQTRILLDEDPTFDMLLDKLEHEGVIDDVEAVKTLVEEEKINVSYLAGGKYIILSGTKLTDLIEGFQKGSNGEGKSEVEVNVIFNTCRDIYDLSGNISKCIVADSTSIVNYILDQKTLNKYGFTTEQIPALFLPKQYKMPYDTDAEEFVAFMAKQFKEFWNEERISKMKALGLSSQSKVTTLASIVYSEQGRVKEEWPIIAGLYLNRLNRGQKLQSDPTFKFCWGHELDGVQRLTKKHREIICDYNTYNIVGLPPGPICITPASIVDAVLNAASVDYIYMCAKPDYSGGHNFTASDRQHINNANAYQKWLAEEIKNKK
ncbi:MAG: endolytic transglycosylase MltG [Crocinitomicaceae bacterium]|nr:endolytic transglycosylase MltG [Crocinitomicaceae bacterium]